MHEGEQLADLFCNFDDFQDNETLDLNQVIMDKENNGRIVRNALSEAQILYSL